MPPEWKRMSPAAKWIASVVVAVISVLVAADIAWRSSMSSRATEHGAILRGMARDLSHLAETSDGNAKLIATTREEQLRRTSAVGRVESLESRLGRLEALVEVIRSEQWARQHGSIEGR